MTSASAVYAPNFFERRENRISSDSDQATMEASKTSIVVEVRDDSIVVLVGGKPPIWLAPVTSSIQRLLSLKPNWDSYGSLPVNPEAAVSALRFLGWATRWNTVPPHLIPTSSGDIQLEWHLNGFDLEIEVDAKGPKYVSFDEPRTRTEISKEIGPDLLLLKDLMFKLPNRA